MRILAISYTWLGANDYSFVRAFRRAGHSVSVISDDVFIPTGWTNPILKGLRRVMAPLMAADYECALIAEVERFRPDLLFAFKGTYLTPAALAVVRKVGGISINFYPDIGFTEHGPHILRTLPHYDWIFTTKSFRIDDMRKELGITKVSFLPHAYDPEVHRPLLLDADDRKQYGSDATFVGTWTPKKEQYLLHVRRRLPELRLKIFGNYWNRANSELDAAVKSHAVFGTEYAKAIQAPSITIAMLVEARPDSNEGDQTTARTFEIPATGGFMLHERTTEAEGYFSEGRECAMFGNSDELVAKLRYYLEHPDERAAIAAAGHRRCMQSGYSVDDRAAAVIAKFRELRV